MCHTGRSWSSTLRGPNLPSSTRSWLIAWSKTNVTLEITGNLMGLTTDYQQPWLVSQNSMQTWDSIENPNHQQVMRVHKMPGISNKTHLRRKKLGASKTHEASSRGIFSRHWTCMAQHFCPAEYHDLCCEFTTVWFRRHLIWNQNPCWAECTFTIPLIRFHPYY